MIDRQRPSLEPQPAASASTTSSDAPTTATFATSGVIPPVGAGHAAAVPTASEQAFDGATPPNDRAEHATTVATAFYGAFASRNTAGMSAFYDPSVQFHDPLFGHLRGSAQVMEMWTAIMPKADPFEITPTVQLTPTNLGGGSWQVHVHWDAHYGLGKALITNHSETTLVIENGRIVSQQDVWDLNAWTKQALPHDLGGNVVANDVLHAAAHSFIEVLDLIRRLQGTPEAR
jgi:hypothetical protein